MDLSLTESESRYYNDLFTLCDVEKTGKIQTLKALELFRSSEGGGAGLDVSEEVLAQVSHHFNRLVTVHTVSLNVI